VNEKTSLCDDATLIMAPIYNISITTNGIKLRIKTNLEDLVHVL
jgi:hypothetical protein